MKTEHSWRKQMDNQISKRSFYCILSHHHRHLHQHRRRRRRRRRIQCLDHQHFLHLIYQ